MTNVSKRLAHGYLEICGERKILVDRTERHNRFPQHSGKRINQLFFLSYKSRISFELFFKFLFPGGNVIVQVFRVYLKHGNEKEIHSIQSPHHRMILHTKDRGCHCHARLLRCMLAKSPTLGSLLHPLFPP